MMMSKIYEVLDLMIPSPKCELNYSKDYELLIATVLSAHSTDKTVNKVTEELFKKFDIKSLAKADIEELKNYSSCRKFQ